MQKNDQLKQQEKKDPIKTAVENNACGSCRAMGLPPPCRGHGGGGSDGEDEKKETMITTSTLTNDVTKSHRIDDPLSYLVKSANWKNITVLDKTLVFTKMDALLSIKIDNENGVLIFRGHRELTKDQEKILKQFFKTISYEFDVFKKQNGIRDNFFVATLNIDNTLTVNIPDKKLFDLFIKQLIAKNLIATPDNLMPAQSVEQKKEGSERKENRPYPNPFDISKGPKPTGWKKE
jgi:hypothetical protein